MDLLLLHAVGLQEEESSGEQRKHRSVGNGSREGGRLRKGLSGGWGVQPILVKEGAARTLQSHWVIREEE